MWDWQEEVMWELNGGWIGNIIIPLLRFIGKWLIISLIFWLIFKVVI